MGALPPNPRDIWANVKELGQVWGLSASQAFSQCYGAASRKWLVRRAFAQPSSIQP